MKIPLFQVDAFTSNVFYGNPAAVCPLEYWLDDHCLQSIAFENNLSETAFFVKKDNHYELKWFTPLAEIDLCGHATLATGHVIFDFLDSTIEKIDFSTKSGKLSVQKKNDLLAMDFPARNAKDCSIPDNLINGLKVQPSEVFLARDYLVVYDSEDIVQQLKPDMDLLSKLESEGVIVTAPGKKYDFISRFFAPKLGIPEDPVTGSSHCTLTPYWAEKLGKNQLKAFQMSKRGGEIYCENKGDRVTLLGKAVTYLKGTIYLPS